MSYPKVITLEVSPGKSTLSFDVLEPSKVVLENQPGTNYRFSAPARAMKITTEHVDDDAVPSLVDDATSSGLPSEDSLAIDSEDDATDSSGCSRLGDVDGSADFALACRHGRVVHSETESSQPDLVLSASTISSGSDDDADVEDLTTSRPRPVLKKPSAPARPGRKGSKAHKNHKGRKGSKGTKRSIAHDESDTSSPTSGTDDSIARRTDRSHHKTSRWTDSHDTLLKNMKEGGETWASIATALGRGKKDVQQRFKEINDESDTSPPTSDTDDSIAQRADKRHHKTSGWTDSHDTLLKSMKEGGETWASIATALGRGKKEVQQRFGEITASKKDGAEKVPRKKKGRAGDKPSHPPSKRSSKKRSQGQRKSMPHLSWSSEDGSTSASPGLESLDSDAQQQIYLQTQIRENLYPPYLSLEEDDHFTKRDCEVLATVDSKMKRGKWLEMQANFYNATGRMVPISVFRDKCEAAEAEERERIREAKIKSWKAGLDRSAQFDPNEPCQAI